MDKEVKKEVWKLFEIALFLFVTILFVLPYLVQVSTYFHERGHMKFLDKYEVRNYYDINLLKTIPNFFNPKTAALGVTKFDFNQYKKLDRYQRAEINIAGTISDLKFLFLIGIYLTLTNVYLFYKIKIKREINLVWMLAINWMLFMWLIVLIQITLANLTHGSGDIYQLIKFLRV
jgi:hypothetical protein